MTAPLDDQLRAAADAGLAHLRRLDADAAADLDLLRRRAPGGPTVVVVGETKRGKSTLVNALLQSPDLSPVDASVATSAYLEFRHGPVAHARAYVPGRPDPLPVPVGDLRDWGTVLGSLPPGTRPPRRIEVISPAPLLATVGLVDTPGVGGLDSIHAEVALDAVERATALLFVVDASSPFSKPELDFLVEASKRVNLVVFALTKTDVHPGWRTVLEDDRALLQAHAPRFAGAAFFPVSARLAELAGQMSSADSAAELHQESRLTPLRRALEDQVAARSALLRRTNLLRSIRSELVRLDQSLAERMRTADPDAATVGALRDERAAVSARKRQEARTWSLTLTTQTRRARTDATSRLRAQVSHQQEWWLNVVDKGGRDQVQRLPYDVDRALHAMSLRLSAELESRFRGIGQVVLREVFDDQEVTQVIGALNARLQHEASSRPRRDGGADQALVVTSSAGVAMMAGKGATLGVGALTAGLAVPVIGIGVGLAAGAFLLYRRKVATDRSQARVWLKEVLGEARAQLSEEIAHRFTDLEYALTVALDDAIERRVQQLDGQIAEIDRAMGEDKQTRQRKKAALSAERDSVRARIKQLDEALARARQAVRVEAPELPDAVVWQD